ncbi:MAG TPA: flagellar hook assembly protein FlgD [Desulfobacterales bacterium]|nr:flagellar hook assembly protein FlgD [Desulfobacterales bacterium]
MSVNAVSSNYSGLESFFESQTKTQNEVQKEDALGRDAFLTMLVAQLKHQDPLNPMEGTDFTAQLAQFSSLEQMFETNDKLEAIRASLDAGKEDNYLDYIGKQILSEGNTLALKDGVSSDGFFTIEKPAEVIIFIYDSSGSEIKRLYVGQNDAGTHEIEWDGSDNRGYGVQDGTYYFKIMAADSLGRDVQAKATATGKVDGVTYQQGAPYLMVENMLIDPLSVVKVWQSEEDIS